MLLENDEDDSRQRGTREHHHSQRGEQAARPKTKKKVVNAFNIVLFLKNETEIDIQIIFKRVYGLMNLQMHHLSLSYTLSIHAMIC